MKKIVFRTDSSSEIGSGHVMRCLTLADELKESGFEVAFICRNHPGNLIELIQQKGYPVHELQAPVESPVDPSINEEVYGQWLGTSQIQDAEEVKGIIGQNKIEWLIIDHYGISKLWESELRSCTKKIMVIDDLANRIHDCDLILDQNYFIQGESRYNLLVSSACSKLLGPTYALLRPEFIEARKNLRPVNGKIKNVLLFFGGSDPDNLTGSALDVLSSPEFQHLNVDVILGASNPNQQKIKKQVQNRGSTQLHIQVNNMAERMAKADLAIGAGGAVTWERLSLHLPSLVIPIAENQIAFSKDLDQQGYIKLLASIDDLPVALHKVLQSGSVSFSKFRDHKELVIDGFGVKRVTDFLTTQHNTELWITRFAEKKDCKLYWAWANDPQVRKSAFNTDPIPWESHQTWFSKKLQDSEIYLVLINSLSGPVGQVRFEKEEKYYLIDYSIGRQYRGAGFGKTLLSKAIQFLQSQLESFTLIGDVKKDNPASSKVFEQLGFEEIKALEKEFRRFKLEVIPKV